MSSTKRLLLKEIFVGEIAGNYTSDAIDLDNSVGFAIVSQALPTTLGNEEFTDTEIALSTITIPTTGYATGLKVRFTTDGTLPTGLAEATDYYLTAITSDVLLVSSSRENLESGVYETILADGDGTHTIVPQAAEAISFKLEGSIDNELWAPINDSLTTIPTSPVMIEHETAFYHYARVKILVTSGQYAISSKLMIKGF